MPLLSALAGKKLVKAARDSIVSYFAGRKFRLVGFPEKRGLFVTIHSYPSHDLRGCIGFPEPVFPINEALPKAALAAAFHDPRFKPLMKTELENVLIEVSVLTKPSLINVKKPDDYFLCIKPGEDGLIVDNGFSSGLLLPIVASEYNWDVEEFLNNTCGKACIPCDSWKDTENCKIYKFQAQVFSEKKPGIV